jgi:cellulose synthase/poly-beta-1,6-N-acetylglucosamine synthase-like glycosyltransferase
LEIIKLINYIIAVTFFICYSYQFFYVIVPFIWKSKPHKKPKLHKYAVLIAARNEEAVIAQLIESIKNQTYRSELIKIFVVADNCTDNTATKARLAGAMVWERFNKQKIGKGYALDFLLEKIRQKYPHNKFDGYFVFDADNLLDENYIAEMNKTFSDGNRIITSYRNSKNYDRNWISAGFSLWFLRESQYLNKSRYLLGTSCAVSGTGFLFHNDIIKKTKGWKFFLLTEDIEFTIHNVIDGEKIAYCETAILYDEQPVKFSQSWAQRMRWAKGYVQVFKKYGAKLAKSVLTKRSFSCFDMAMNIMPAIVLSVLSGIINLGGAIYSLLLGGNIVYLLESVSESILNIYLVLFLLGLITTITEWNRIYCSTAKKLLYTLTFPLFMFTYIPISIIALFIKVEWKQIHHIESKTLEDVRSVAKQFTA